MHFVARALAALMLLSIVRRVWSSRRRGRRGSVAQEPPNPDPPLLVITPAGFVEYAQPDYPIVAVAFGDLATLALRVTASTMSNSMMSDSMISNRMPATTHIWLDLHYRDGRIDRWNPRANFGQTEAIVQAIIAARGKYEATH
jgi:hypothetical protein